MDQPWLKRKDWAEGRIRDKNRGAFFTLLAVAVFWNAISWPALIGVFQKDTDPLARWMVPLFPLIGLCLIAGAVYQFRRWTKFGTSTFEMAEVPGVIGGNLGGVILTRVNLRPADGFRLSLRCQRHTTRGSGKNRSTQITTLWESEQSLAQDALADDPTQSALPVLFTIPYHCEPTEKSGSSRVVWELKVRASLPGVDYEARFEVPVFRTADSDPALDEDAARAAMPAAVAGSGEDATDWAASGLTIREDMGGATRVETGFARHWLLLGVPLLIGLAMLGGAFAAWRSTEVPFIFPLAFLGFGLLVTLSVGGALFSSLRLRIFPDRLEWEHRRFLFNQRRTIPVGQIRSLECKSTMSSGETAFYDIVVHLEGGGRETLPFRAKGQARAMSLVRLIESKTGTQLTDRR